MKKQLTCLDTGKCDDDNIEFMDIEEYTHIYICKKCGKHYVYESKYLTGLNGYPLENN